MAVRTKKITSIQTTIAVSFTLLMVMLIGIIGILSYYMTGKIVEDNTEEYVGQLLNQVTYDVEFYLKNIDNTLEVLLHHEEIRGYFERLGSSATQREVVASTLNGFMVSRSDIANIFLMKETGEIIVNASEYELKKNLGFKQVDWYRETLGQGAMTVSSSHVQYFLEDRYTWVVSCGRQYSHRLTQKPLGVVMVDLNFQLINDMASNIRLGDKGYLFIVNEKGEFVYHPKQQLIYSGLQSEPMAEILALDNGLITLLENGQKKHYMVSSSSYAGWKIVGTYFAQDINTFQPVLKQFFAIMVVLAFLISTLLSLLIAKSILHPVKELAQAMVQVTKGDLETEILIQSNNEIGQLALMFNRMTRRIQELLQKNKEAERRKRKSELEALQAQINPHFLYNTLDSIVWMAEAGNNQEVVKMTSSLAKLFRISINRGAEYITLSQELEHVESYLIIQKMRYGDKLTYHIEADSSVLSVRVIKIMIQPIVENAIYHGIKAMAGAGHINVSVHDSGDKIRIDVADNGVGMADPESYLRSENPNSGVGLWNVDQRIKLYYGQDYGLIVESELYVGTTVSFFLPRFTEGEVTDHEANQ